MNDYKQKFKMGDSVTVVRKIKAPNEHLNGVSGIIEDAYFKGCAGWFYKLTGQPKWFNEQCFYQ